MPRVCSAELGRVPRGSASVSCRLLPRYACTAGKQGPGACPPAPPSPGPLCCWWLFAKSRVCQVPGALPGSAASSLAGAPLRGRGGPRLHGASCWPLPQGQDTPAWSPSWPSAAAGPSLCATCRFPRIPTKSLSTFRAQVFCVSPHRSGVLPAKLPRGPGGRLRSRPPALAAVCPSGGLCRCGRSAAATGGKAARRSVLRAPRSAAARPALGPRLLPSSAAGTHCRRPPFPQPPRVLFESCTLIRPLRTCVFFGGAFSQ